MRTERIFLILILISLLFMPYASTGSDEAEIEITMNHIFVNPASDHLEIAEVLAFRNTGTLSFNGTIEPKPFDGWQDLDAEPFKGEIKPNESVQMMLSYRIEMPGDSVKLTKITPYHIKAVSLFLPVEGNLSMIDKGSFETATGRTIREHAYYVLESYDVHRESTIWASFGAPQQHEEEADENSYNIGMIVFFLALITIALFPNLRDYRRKRY